MSFYDIFVNHLAQKFIKKNACFTQHALLFYKMNTFSIFVHSQRTVLTLLGV